MNRPWWQPNKPCRRQCSNLHTTKGGQSQRWQQQWWQLSRQGQQWGPKGWKGQKSQWARVRQSKQRSEQGSRPQKRGREEVDDEGVKWLSAGTALGGRWSVSGQGKFGNWLVFGFWLTKSSSGKGIACIGCTKPKKKCRIWRQSSEGGRGKGCKQCQRQSWRWGQDQGV